MSLLVSLLVFGVIPSTPVIMGASVTFMFYNFTSIRQNIDINLQFFHFVAGYLRYLSYFLFLFLSRSEFYLNFSTANDKLIDFNGVSTRLGLFYL